MTVSHLFFKTPMQARTFLLLVIAGGMAALLLCALKWAGRCLPRSVAAACDAVFWCLCAALCAIALSFGGEGQLRWYAVFGMLTGTGVMLCALRLLLSPFRRKKKESPPPPTNEYT